MKLSIPVLLSAVILASCGKENSPGGASPQEAFENARSAGARMDFGGLYDAVCPDERDGQVLGAVMAGAFTAGGDQARVKEFEAIRKKFNLPESPNLSSVDTTSRAGMKALSEMMKDVKDKRGFVVEAGAFAKKYSKPGDTLHMDGTLKDVKETGDTATATLVEPSNSESPIRFRKIEGRWYVSLLEK